MSWFHIFTSLLCSVLLLSSAGFLPANSQSQMEYRDLCQSPVDCKSISRLILGTDHLGKLPQEQTEAVLNEALKLGINTFDTAPIYTDLIESRLGKWLKTQSKELYVISKGGFPRDLGPGTYQSRLKGKVTEIRDNVDEEIQASRAHYPGPISIYLMHRDDLDFQDYVPVQRVQTPVETILQALSDPILTQQYDFLGLSNWQNDRVEQALMLSDQHPEWKRPVCHSPYFSLMEMGSKTIHSGGVQVSHTQMMDPDFQKGLKLMPYSPLGGFSLFSRGWDAAKQHALQLKQSGDRYWRNVYDAIFHEANHQRYLRAEAFTRTFNQKHQSHYTLDQLVNAYALAHVRADYLIIGPRSIEQLHRTVQSLELAKQLSAADLEFLYQNR